MIDYYRVGSIGFTISGEGNYFESLRNYFSEKRVKDVVEDSLIDIIVDEKGDASHSFTPELYSLSGNIAFNHKSFRIKKRNWSYIVSNLFNDNAPTTIILSPPSHVKRSFRKRIFDFLIDAEVGNHDLSSAFVQGIANYSCLWYLFAVSLMKRRVLFVHSGMMSKKGKGIVVTGTGGCGKTSTMMELITNCGYDYIAEDFGMLDSRGYLYDMQKKAAIYESDVKWGNPLLLRAINNLPRKEHIEWNIKLKTGRSPVHYFKPSDIFGQNICHKAELDGLFYIRRGWEKGEIVCKKITKEDFVERTKNASFRELKELYEILSNIRAVGGESYYCDYPSIFMLENKYKDILTEASGKVIANEITVPLKVNPAKTVEKIFKSLI